MPRRKRLTSAKKARKRTGGDPDAPSEAEWETMHQYGSFVVRDEDDEEYMFSTGDTARVFPDHRDVSETLEFYEYWVVKIKDIRAHGEDVWARVQWYYSGQDVASVIKSFDADACGKYERIFSDHFDFLHTSSFDGVVVVRKFNETSLEQNIIEKNEFYCRYTLECGTRWVDPKPGITTCICSLPYSPDDSSAVMHFCPRPSCRRSYHEKCLIKGNHLDTAVTLPERKLQLLTSSPDTDSVFSIVDLASSQPPKKRRRGRPKKGGDGTGEADSISNIAAARDLFSRLGIPDDLILVAQQPIIRGHKSGGVAGNVKAVVEARRLIYAAVSGQSEVPEDWEDTIDVNGAVGTVLSKKVSSTLVCPGCRGPI